MFIDNKRVRRNALCVGLLSAMREEVQPMICLLFQDDQQPIASQPPESPDPEDDEDGPANGQVCYCKWFINFLELHSVYLLMLIHYFSIPLKLLDCTHLITNNYVCNCRMVTVLRLQSFLKNP